ncbi:hypothetical protein GCM10028804_07870 [Larkinella terrae]
MKTVYSRPNLIGGLLMLATAVLPAAAQSPDTLARSINLAGRDYAITQLPKPLTVRADLGIATTLPSLQGQIIHRARNRQGGLYETRATVTPNGDYLLMFPDGGHYGHAKTKTNDMLAYRSKDKGKTWQGPTVAFDIDYNQHGFIPFIPRGSNRIYAFGTQPVWGTYSREDGLQENAPIGYRYSDNDGISWSEVRLIRPKNDPGYLGMSVMRMTETANGTWLLGTHEGDWSYKPLMTRLYLLRSDDKGQTWTLLPGKRHGGWHAKGFNRMDEGRPIALGGNNVLFMMRTAEGHLWSSRSTDDGQTWPYPQPTPLVHPDAPPMLFHLSDNKTLIALHHNRHSNPNNPELNGNDKKQMQDRSEVWFSTSTDEGATWSEPRLLFVNALGEGFAAPFRNYQCSYIDLFVDNGQLHLFVPHRWERVLYLRVPEADLGKCPTKAQLKL